MVPEDPGSIPGTSTMTALLEPNCRVEPVKEAPEDPSKTGIASGTSTRSRCLLCSVVLERCQIPLVAGAVELVKRCASLNGRHVTRIDSQPLKERLSKASVLKDLGMTEEAVHRRDRCSD